MHLISKNMHINFRWEHSELGVIIKQKTTDNTTWLRAGWGAEGGGICCWGFLWGSSHASQGEAAGPSAGGALNSGGSTGGGIEGGPVEGGPGEVSCGMARFFFCMKLTAFIVKAGFPRDFGDLKSGLFRPI